MRIKSIIKLIKEGDISAKIDGEWAQKVVYYYFYIPSCHTCSA